MGYLKKVFLGLYWDARREGLDDCAQKLSWHFNALGEHSSALSVWFKKASSKKSALREVDLSSVESIKCFLEGGINKRDFSGELIPELGYSVFAWNGGAEGVTASTHVACGIYSDNPHISNVSNIEINFKEPVEFSWEELFGRLVEIWSPQHGKVSLIYEDGRNSAFRYEKHVRKLGFGPKASPQFGGFMIAE